MTRSLGYSLGVHVGGASLLCIDLCTVTQTLLMTFLLLLLLLLPLPMTTNCCAAAAQNLL